MQAMYSSPTTAIKESMVPNVSPTLCKFVAVYSLGCTSSRLRIVYCYEPGPSHTIACSERLLANVMAAILGVESIQLWELQAAPHANLVPQLEVVV